MHGCNFIVWYVNYMICILGKNVSNAELTSSTMDTSNGMVWHDNVLCAFLITASDGHDLERKSYAVLIP